LPIFFVSRLKIVRQATVSLNTRVPMYVSPSIRVVR
jgi:hypothetical protein